MKKLSLFLLVLCELILYSCKSSQDIYILNFDNEVSVSMAENLYLVSKEEALQIVCQILV